MRSKSFLLTNHTEMVKASLSICLVVVLTLISCGKKSPLEKLSHLMKIGCTYDYGKIKMYIRGDVFIVHDNGYTFRFLIKEDSVIVHDTPVYFNTDQNYSQFFQDTDFEPYKNIASCIRKARLEYFRSLSNTFTLIEYKLAGDDEFIAYYVSPFDSLSKRDIAQIKAEGELVDSNWFYFNRAGVNLFSKSE